MKSEPFLLNHPPYDPYLHTMPAAFWTSECLGMQSTAQQTDLGHLFWADKAASLDVDCTRVPEAIDELNLERQGYDARFVLETVLRADLDSSQ